MKKLLLLFSILTIYVCQAQDGGKSIRSFNVLPTNDAETNKQNLQKAIDWASASGAALWVEPSEEPYTIASGIILKRNVSLIGVHGPTPRGTRHASKKQPVGSVFRIIDTAHAFITVESATQVKGIQFWYASQELTDRSEEHTSELQSPI